MIYKTQLNEIDFDLDGYINHLDEHMRDMTKEAARSWLTKVLSIVPTWSRASRATFEALGQSTGFIVSYGPIRAPKDRWSLGKSTGRGELEFTNTSWSFWYETDLRYLAYNDQNAAIYGVAPGVFSRAGIPNTPYNFVEAGQIDFKSFARNFVKLVDPTLYIKPKRI